ncbi:hypothetical protein C1N83_27445 (plasmid) [Priestia aryabhattai]|uniref:Uncharacterized protein n=1 Tax=Priestia megaterium TaxID=1404 RepID=A0AAX6BJS5_PRIMG|nr:hypothetical protein [Priestia megaterium]PHF77566.1 hypothetical protein COI42_04020 [Priestia aryabhattai]QFY73274.1 hypothetical protein CEQ83_12300 [Priestia megaterium]GMG73994.1 hypothetical protein ShirakiTB12_24620 [Priestia megaterium]
MDFIFNFIVEFIKTIIYGWLVLFAFEKLNVFQLEKKTKWIFILTLSLILGIIFALIDLL